MLRRPKLSVALCNLGREVIEALPRSGGHEGVMGFLSLFSSGAQHFESLGFSICLFPSDTFLPPSILSFYIILYLHLISHLILNRYHTHFVLFLCSFLTKLNVCKIFVM